MRKGYNYALLDAAGADVGAGPEALAGAGGSPGDEPLPLRGAREKIRGGDDDKYIPPMRGEYFDIVLMQADVPIVEKRYTLVLPASKRLISQEYNGPVLSRTEYAGDETRYSWWVENVTALPHEPRQPAASDISPQGRDGDGRELGSEEPSGSSTSTATSSRSPTTSASKVSEILAAPALTTRSEPPRWPRCSHWVAQNIRYSGQTMGEGEGYTLHPGTMIFEQRSGVCKDIAGMLITMLRAAGMRHATPP